MCRARSTGPAEEVAKESKQTFSISDVHTASRAS